MVTKKRTGNNPRKKNQDKSNSSGSIDNSSQTSSPSPNVPSPNVHSIAQESENSSPAKDINQKLGSLEETLSNLETRFYLSHEEFEQVLNGVNTRGDLSNGDIKELQVQLSKLNSSYQVLDTQSGRLAKETGRLALLIDKLNVDKLEAIGEFEQQLIARFESSEGKVESLDKALKKSGKLQQKTLQSLKTEIVAEYKILHDGQQKQAVDIKQIVLQNDQNETQAKTIQLSVNQQSEKIELLLSSAVSATQQRESISSALTEQAQKINKRIDDSNLKNSSAQQFLDRKQQVLIQQTEDIAVETQDIKQSFQTLSSSTEKLQQQSVQLEQKLIEQKLEQQQQLESANQTISASINSLDNKLSNALSNKISALTEKTTYEYQDLLRQYELGKKQAELIIVRQDGLSESLDNIDAENQKAVDKLQRGLTQQDENLQAAQKQSEQISSQQQTEIDTLHSFDQKLAQNAQQLEQRTENLEQQEAQQQEKLVQLNTQSVLTTETSKKTQRQVDYVIQQEKSHFNLFSRSLIFVIIVIAVASIFGYQHFQKISAMDTSLSKLAKQKPFGKPLEIKAVAIETQAQAALKQQLKSQVQQQQLLKQQQTALVNDQVNYLKQQQLVQQQLTGLQQQLTAQQQKLQAKDEKISLLSQEVQEVDDNLQLLNHSVGPNRGFNRSAEQGKLHSPLWLKQQPADNYTVQLLSVAQKAHIFQFIQRYGYHLNNNLAYFNVQADDSSQFVLTYGSFKEKAAAEQALEQLPGTVSHYNLGVALMQNVQSLMQ